MKQSWSLLKMKGNGLTVSADMLKHHDQDQRGLILTACSPSFREAGWKLSAKTDVEALEESLLPCPLWLAQSTFL